MKKKLKMKKNLKYLILAFINSIFIWNAPLFISRAETLNAFRQNMIIIGLFVLLNSITILKIEN